MNQIIIYGSQYGTTKSYAEELSKRVGIAAVRYEEVKDISAYDEIIYLGGLYAGGVKGLKETLKPLPEDTNAKIIIATVGLADVTDQINTDTIKTNLKNQLSDKIYEKAKLFHLRGGIDYSRLTFKHKAMMALLYKMTKKTPAEKQTAEQKGIIETYNKEVSFVDFNSLQAIIDVL